MFLKKLISLAAKRIYPQEYCSLKQSVTLAQIKLNSKENLLLYPAALTDLLIIGEDRRFHMHIGFDIIAIARALKNKVLYNKREGASTIEQQLVRVLLSRYERTYRRKIKEIFLATTLTDLVSKEMIPHLYLSVAYYGTGMTGIKQLFKKLQISNHQTLSDEVSAEIIARIKYPEPSKNKQKRLKQIHRRKDHLLKLYYKHNSNALKHTYG